MVFSLEDGLDAFVTKLNAPGSALLYSTYLGGGARQGGSGTTRIGPGIAIDGAGNAYVAGKFRYSLLVVDLSGGCGASSLA